MMIESGDPELSPIIVIGAAILIAATVVFVWVYAPADHSAFHQLINAARPGDPL